MKKFCGARIFIALAVATLLTSHLVAQQKKKRVRPFVTEKIICPRVSGGEVFGVMYKPSVAEEQKVPLVIRGHGFNGKWNDNTYYAENFAKNGIACYALDFTGASNASQSKGVSPLEYSALTMAEDYKAVIEKLSSIEYIDLQKIFIMGESQGGLVAVLTAPQVQEKICALLLVYPALCIKDDGIKRYGTDISKYPSSISLWGFTYGKKYYEDLVDIDIFATLREFPKQVLIIHGTADNIVPISWSEKATKEFPNAKLITLAGAGHGFAGSALSECATSMTNFVKDLSKD